MRRLFHAASGRPSGTVVRTQLLGKLEKWASSLATGQPGAPRIVLLVGGPGNGKTEAVEFAVRELDNAFALSGSLVLDLERQFLGSEELPTPRLARVDLSTLSPTHINLRLGIVQDASVSDVGSPGISPAQLLVSDLENALRTSSEVYLACINRGVLDDALIVATDATASGVREVLEKVVLAVGMGPESLSRSCWPLSEYPFIGVWPMDVETMISDSKEHSTISPAAQLLELATDPNRWPQFGSCAAGESCPFCISREQLSSEFQRESLLKILRWYELASGKRWTFRDLFSLLSHLLAGVPTDDSKAAKDPCEWAAGQSEAIASGKPEAARLRAPFMLVAAQYQHALFGIWPRVGVRALREDLRELHLQEDATLVGLCQFLSLARGLSTPPTLDLQLSTLKEILDPAIADPEMEVQVSGRTTITFRDVDMRFSHSVGEGLQFIQRYKCLSQLETNLLTMLSGADKQVLHAGSNRHRPLVAARVSSIIRNFACRLVRRSIGVRCAAVRDALILAHFQRVVDGDAQLLHEAVKQVEGLLNDRDKFVVVLNTTFGEAMPALPRRLTLTTEKQKVKPKEQDEGKIPRATVRFLSVGSGLNMQSIPLTYPLYKAVYELRHKMIPASLPRAVVALLDTTRARLGGQVVRDEELLEGSEIRIGPRSDVIVRELGRFLVRRDDEQ